MEFRIADSFTTSLDRLTGEEKKAAKQTAFELQLNPAHPSLQFHRIEKSKDKDFWSVRVNADIRIIVHKSADDMLLCYVDHHDKAYLWAERRKLEVHPRTGAAQFVEVRERVQEILVPVYVDAPMPAKPAKPVLAHVSEEELLLHGVPQEWVRDLKTADEKTILALSSHLPAEAAEAVLEFATGGRPVPRILQKSAPNPFAHPDAQRRFRVLQNAEELEQALAYPWEKWILFLHPGQREWVDKEFTGPARISGSAGTGKTIVALHRTAALARKHTDDRVLLTTFSEPLANALRSRLLRLLKSEPRLMERIDVADLSTVGQRLYKANIGGFALATEGQIHGFLDTASSSAPSHKFTSVFLRSEWSDVVDAWQVRDWDAYRDIKRLGRKTRLPEAQRKALWSIFEKVIAALAAKGLSTESGLFTRLAEHYSGIAKSPYAFIVTDESQDLQVAQLRFLAALGKGRPNALFFAGDLGQRIFQLPFSWKSLGVDMRGRSTTLKVNYRTSHQIRGAADRLLGPEVSDADGNTESRRGTVSVFNGPEPEVRVHADALAEVLDVSEWLRERKREGLQGHELGVFVRTASELERAQTAVGASGYAFRILNRHLDIQHAHVSIGTMHLAKGLEFRAVAVMACDEGILPLESRLEEAGEQSDLESNYDTERQLLYVACTRARDRLLITSGGEPSEFLADFKPKDSENR